MGCDTSTLLNGRPGTLIDATDRGFQYGDGVFTTLRVENGIPLFFQEHFHRLARDAALLRLPLPDFALLRHEAGILSNQCSSGILKIQWTRGIGGRGYLPPADPEPTRFLILRPFSPLGEGLSKAWNLKTASLRLGICPQLAGAKHMNRLEQILARQEWPDPSIDEVLLLDSEGYVVEGSSTNLFLFHDGVLITPRLDRAGVRGVLRDIVLGYAEKYGMPVRQDRVRPEQLLEATELVLTNSVRGICPVARLDAHDFNSNEIALKLHAWYQEALSVTRKVWQ